MAYYYYQDGHKPDELWKPIREDKLYTIEGAMFVTILSVDSPVPEEASREQLAEIKYNGPLYFDLDDATSPASTAIYAKQLVKKLEENGVFPAQLEIYASGGKGFHILVPRECFMAKPPKGGLAFLPAIYKEMAFSLAVPSMDFRVYTARRGRMFRQQNVLRPNGLYKVRISYAELESLVAITDKAEAEAAYKELCSAPRRSIDIESDTPELATGMLALFDQAKAKVSKAAARNKKAKPVSLPKDMPSFDALLRGEGLKPDAGFQNIAMQVAITAHAKGMTCEELLAASEGLCAHHQSDGTRYNTPAKRREELARMWNYTADNPCYAYSPSAVTALLTHTAPDMHGLTVTEDEVAEAIAEKTDSDDVASEYAHAGLIMTRQGAFTLTENGPKMVTAVSFDNVTELVSAEDSRMSVLEADLYIAGRKISSNVPIELDSFNSVSSVNKVLMRHGQVFSGNDVQARGMFLRMVEKARKSGKRMYVSSREGLDIVKIAGHDSEAVRKGFLVWSDNRGVAVPPHIQDTGVQMRFVGYPDPHGQFQTDIEDAPKLTEWLKDEANKEDLRVFLHNLLHCQSPAHIGKLLGWMVAAYWRMLFHEKFDKFPLMHINGSAGMGKCLGKDTPVIMADGTIKKVQDVVVGDKLLGPDGTVRNVLSLARGREMLYRVDQNKGDSYVVNESHILSLRGEGGPIINRTVLEYLQAQTMFKETFKGWKVPGILRGNTEPELCDIQVTKLEEGDYYGFGLDGDKLFLLGDFTVTHNTETTKLFCNLHYYNTEPKMLTPTSTIFAVTSAISGSSSIPLVLDEFKPAEMNPQTYDKFKLVLRDAYNCRVVERGGGTRESSDYRSVHRTALSAPIIFIAEAAESESALMERVVLLTQIKPPASHAIESYKRYSKAVEKKEYLGIIGKYIATSIVRKTTVESFNEEFLPIYNDTRKELMLSGDEENLSEAELSKKTGAKERTVFNYAVCKFGLRKFQNLVKGIFGNEFDEIFQEMWDNVCSSVEDIQSHTTPEWLKVLNTFTDMTRLDPESPCFIVQNREYAYVSYNGKNCIEFNLRACYHKYRQYMAMSRSKPLFPGEPAFVFAMSTSSALEAKGVNVELDVPGGSYIFDLQELRSNGFIAP